jgi:hypothetical protein
MPTLSVRGINYGDIQDFTDDQLQDLRGSVFLQTEPANKFDRRAIAVMGKYRDGNAYKSVRLGYVSSELLDRAHRESWCEWRWEIDEIGRFKPRYAMGLNASTRVFCRLSDRETHLLRNITDDEDVGPSLMARMKTDDSLYDGTICVCIHYESESSGLGWRDVVLLGRTDDEFVACDGSSDHRGRPIPQKSFKFAQLRAARCLENIDEDDEILSPRPTKRAKLA